MRLEVGKGITEYLQRLEHLYNASEETCGKAVYAGADIVSDEIKKNLEAIPTDEGFGSESNKLQGIKQIQKTGLIHAFGIARLRNDSGYWNVKAGFDGYNLLKTKKYPQGQPNPMIARTLESGNSFTKKHPFVGPAIRATKDQAERKMAEVVDQEADRIVNHGG